MTTKGLAPLGSMLMRLAVVVQAGTLGEADARQRVEEDKKLNAEAKQRQEGERLIFQSNDFTRLSTAISDPV